MDKDYHIVQFDHIIHDRTDFFCGVEEIDDYIRKSAIIESDLNLSRIYILKRRENNKVAGFYSLCNMSVSVKDVPGSEGITYRSFPATLLGRLGLNNNLKGQHYGKALVYHAMRVSLGASEAIGSRGLVVDAKNDSLCKYYEDLGFSRHPGKKRLIMTMEYIRVLLDPQFKG